MRLFAQHQNNVIDEVIWVVGDEAILKSDVEAARLDFGASINGNPYCVIPEQLAIQKLFLQQLRTNSFVQDLNNSRLYSFHPRKFLYPAKL